MTDVVAAFQAAKGFMPLDEGLALHAAAKDAATLGLPLLEIGTYCGRSTILLADAAASAGTVVVTVDHHRGSEEQQRGWEYHDTDLEADTGTGLMDTLPEFRRTLRAAGLEEHVIAIVGRSPQVAALWRQPLGLVFVDGGHTDAHATADYEGWAPLVAENGLLVIHDVFADPADGGQAPYRIYRRALDSGCFTELPATGSLHILRRGPAAFPRPGHPDRVLDVFRNESGGGARSGLLVFGVVAAAAALLAGCAGGGAGSGDDTGKDAAALTPEATSSPSPADGKPAAGMPDDGKPDDGKGAGPLATVTKSAAKPLAGKIVVLDPGHNINNAEHTAEINRLVDVGNARKECDTTGTETNAGYPEAKYTLDMSHRVRDLLVARGATVKLTYDGDRPYGPCVDERARIGNEAHADAALSVHADGAPAADRGFHVIAPKSMHVGKADTRKIAGPSYTLATTLRAHFRTATGEPFADYLGGGKGMTVRDDLGGLNLSLVPKVFIECGNMRNAQDAEELTDPAWRQHAALGIADGLTAFLEGKR